MASQGVSRFILKKTTFLGRKVSILCQNENGPCPLLAISNVLLLRGYISISLECKWISSDELIQIIANRLIESNPPLENEILAKAQEKNLNDVIVLLPQLLVGLDVNVRFNSVSDFEFTTELATFDLLDINLVHGWIIDPANEAMVSAIEGKSYNQLVSELVDYRSVEGATERTKTIETIKRERSLSDTSAEAKLDEILSKGATIDTFLQDTASQLTDYGLTQLNQNVRERELCVFFRNNHFSTLFKMGGKLYLLVTDTGYYDQPNVIWESLCEIHGNTFYLDPEFKPLSVPPSDEVINTQAEEQDSDYMLALKLQNLNTQEANESEIREQQENLRHLQAQRHRTQEKTRGNRRRRVESDDGPCILQ